MAKFLIERLKYRREMQIIGAANFSANNGFVISLKSFFIYEIFLYTDCEISISTEASEEIFSFINSFITFPAFNLLFLIISRLINRL